MKWTLIKYMFLFDEKFMLNNPTDITCWFMMIETYNLECNQPREARE